MKPTFDLTRLTLWINRLIAMILGVLLFTLPALLDWYSTFRFLTELEHTAITVSFYLCAAFVFVALWHMDRLLRSILRREVFIHQNVRRIRVVQWCCAAISLICLPTAFIYYPLIFLVVIMAFLCLVISVVCRVMDTAVSIREENDLTV
jgi:hypothetical protein